MKIVVIGGSGLIGSKLVNQLREHGHEAVAASPNSGVNSVTGKGLAEGLKGASAVVDVTNSPSWEDAAVLKFFETSIRNLLTHEAAAGVGHHVALSVVGTDRLAESGYFRAKIAQEKLIQESVRGQPSGRDRLRPRHGFRLCRGSRVGSAETGPWNTFYDRRFSGFTGGRPTEVNENLPPLSDGGELIVTLLLS